MASTSDLPRYLQCMPPVVGSIHNGRVVPTFVLAIPFEDEDMWHFCAQYDRTFKGDHNRHVFALDEARVLLEDVARLALVYPTQRSRKNPITGVYFATNTCQESLDLAQNLETVKYIQEALFTTKTPRWYYIKMMI